jgi:hypothetical protein
MINAAQGGLPLDMTNLPVPPQMAGSAKSSLVVPQPSTARISPRNSGSNIVTSSLSSFEIVNAKDAEPMETDRDSVYRRLIKDLAEQIKLVANNAKHFTSMGDIHNAKQ